jgi:nucleotidyltransferase/DNA polymerase involved in DNA repair
MSNWATKMVVGAAFGAAVAMAISLAGGVNSRDNVIQAQETPAGPDEPDVTEAELEVYIDVYRAMQGDRSLKITEAVERREMSVAEFRAIERRVQGQERLIKRVRESLLEQAVENAASLVQDGVAPHP